MASNKLMIIFILICFHEYLLLISATPKYLIFNTIVDSQTTAEVHNKYRRQYGVPSLKPDIKLAMDAKKCLKNMLLMKKMRIKDHPCNPGKSKQGENIYEIKDGNYHPSTSYYEMAVKIWNDEVNNINFKEKSWYMNLKTNDRSKPIGHFTQLVWRSTTKVGCAYGFLNAFRKRPSKLLVVCRYFPRGNSFTASKIKENVPAASSAKSCEDSSVFCKVLKCEDMLPALRTNCPAKCNQCKK